MDDLQALAVSVISVADFVAFSAFFGFLVFVFLFSGDFLGRSFGDLVVSG